MSRISVVGLILWKNKRIEHQCVCPTNNMLTLENPQSWLWRVFTEVLVSYFTTEMIINRWQCVLWSIQSNRNTILTMHCCEHHRQCVVSGDRHLWGRFSILWSLSQAWIETGHKMSAGGRFILSSNTYWPPEYLWGEPQWSSKIERME